MASNPVGSPIFFELTTTHSEVDCNSDSEYCERSLTRANAALIAGEYEYVIGASSGFSLSGAPVAAYSIFCALARGVRIDTNISNMIEIPIFDLAFEH